MNEIFTVIVTYNGASWIERCIQSLLAGHEQASIVVIDNASSDNTIELLQAFGQQIKLIRNTENRGFGYASNQGMKYAYNAGAQYCLLLNQDCYVFENTIELLASAFSKNKSYGILCPLQLNGEGNEIDKRAKSYIHRSFPEMDQRKLFQTDKNLTVYPLRFMNAAAWMISRYCLETTGLFHPAFFHYGEDNNYASRVQYHKLKLGLVSAARVIHDRGDEKSGDQKILLRKLNTVPLYTLTDLRKPLPLAYFLARLSWSRIAKKLRKISRDYDQNIAEQKSWFTSRLGEAKKIRRETAIPGFLIK